MSAVGAHMILLRPCDLCGEWPHRHTQDCPVQLARDDQNRALLALMAAAAGVRDGDDA